MFRRTALAVVGALILASFFALSQPAGAEAPPGSHFSLPITGY
jgi:hypothetical protein